MPVDDEILRALRRITRAIDLHSRKLSGTFGLTGPQLICLRALEVVESMTPGALAKEVSLSQATITGIIDRLSARQLVTRVRDEVDRRLVNVRITEAGRALVGQAPSPLQEVFLERLNGLPLERQAEIRDMLNLVVRMMDGEEIDAAPILSAGGGVSRVEIDETLAETED